MMATDDHIVRAMAAWLRRSKTGTSPQYPHHAMSMEGAGRLSRPAQWRSQVTPALVQGCGSGGGMVKGGDTSCLTFCSTPRSLNWVLRP